MNPSLLETLPGICGGPVGGQVFESPSRAAHLPWLRLSGPGRNV